MPKLDMEKYNTKMHLYCGDFRKSDLLPPDNSIDLIFTDPPYLKKYVPIYGDLGKFAARVLRPGGSLVCYIGHYNLPDYVALLAPHLTFWWIFSVGLERPGFPMNNRHIVPKFKPLLWYVKGEYKGKYVYDHVESTYQGKNLHEWQQSTTEALHFISRLSEEGDTILDPFGGSGTTGIACLALKRKFIGYEIDPKTFAMMQARLYLKMQEPVLTQRKL